MPPRLSVDRQRSVRQASPTRLTDREPRER
ncbi:MAG: hypothetical protein QOI13_3006 [Paraburkholderia sp.]|jgi:hypothetical protein|nr:hypothetical protein [Paraburkholderia sp.]